MAEPNYEAIMQILLDAVKNGVKPAACEAAAEDTVPVGISNRHIHLSFYTFTLSKNQRFLIAKKER